MFCGQCGKELVEGARFCSSCGAQVGQAQTAGENWQTAGQVPPAAYQANQTNQGWGYPGAYQGAGYAGYQPPLGDPLTRLQRPRANRMVAGVCVGLAMHYRWDLTWVRVLTVLITIFSSGAGLVAYIVFWLVMPEEPWMLPNTTDATTGTVPPPPVI